MSGWVLSADADGDLQDIYLYSLETWGEAQAVHYLGQMFATFDLLGGNPNIGRGRPEIGAGIRSFPHGSHVVFFIEWQGETAILRVLHGSRDIDELFADSEPFNRLD